MSMRALIAWLERALWLVLCATLLWQTRVIVWTTGGLRFVEWKSFALYATDIVAVVLVGLALLGGWRPWRHVHARAWLLLGWISLTVAWSQSWILSVVTCVRLIEIGLLALYLRDRVLAYGLGHASGIALCVGALGQAVLAITQYTLGQDVGLRLIGETILDPEMKGVAVFLDHGERVLRAYGSLPHPNVLAFALVCALGILVWHWSQHRGQGLVTWVHASATALLTLGIWVTFSRAYILVLLVVVGVGLAIYRAKSVVRLWAGTILVVSLAFCVIQSDRVYARMVLGSSEEAVTLRITYAHDALTSGNRGINWLGVGAGAYVPWLEAAHPGYPWYWYQPTHSIFLLWYAEVGLIGLAFIGWLLMSMRARSLSVTPETMLAIALCVSVLGAAVFVDHFLWTLQQGRLILALGVGAILSPPRS